MGMQYQMALPPAEMEAQRQACVQNRQKLEEQNKARMQEGVSASQIRQVLKKCQSVTREGLEDLQQEIAQSLVQHLQACGSQAQQMKDEADKALAEAKEWIQKDEEEKAEKEKQRLEAIEQAEKMLKELEQMTEEAEKASAVLLKKAAPFTEKDASELSLEKLQAVGKVVDDAGIDAREKIKTCSDFIMKNGTIMKSKDTVPKKEGEDEAAGLTLAKLLARSMDVTK